MKIYNTILPKWKCLLLTFKICHTMCILKIIVLTRSLSLFYCLLWHLGFGPSRTPSVILHSCRVLLLSSSPKCLAPFLKKQFWVHSLCELFHSRSLVQHLVFRLQPLMTGWRGQKKNYLAKTVGGKRQQKASFSGALPFAGLRPKMFR